MIRLRRGRGEGTLLRVFQQRVLCWPHSSQAKGTTRAASQRSEWTSQTRQHCLVSDPLFLFVHFVLLCVVPFFLVICFVTLPEKSIQPHPIPTPKHTKRRLCQGQAVPTGSKYPIFKDSGSKDHAINGFWDQSP